MPGKAVEPLGKAADDRPADTTAGFAEWAMAMIRQMTAATAPSDTTTNSPSEAASVSRSVAVGSLLGLVVLGLLWELVLAPTGQRTLALKVLPLAFALAGLLKYRLYTYRWLSLLVWLYFTEGVVRASGDHGISAVLAAIEVGLSLALFAACAWHVRGRLRAGKELPQ